MNNKLFIYNIKKFVIKVEWRMFMGRYSLRGLPRQGAQLSVKYVLIESLEIDGGRHKSNTFSGMSKFKR